MLATDVHQDPSDREEGKHHTKKEARIPTEFGGWQIGPAGDPGDPGQPQNEEHEDEQGHQDGACETEFGVKPLYHGPFSVN
jgi:hypothetical protein